MNKPIAYFEQHPQSSLWWPHGGHHHEAALTSSSLTHCCSLFWRPRGHEVEAASGWTLESLLRPPEPHSWLAGNWLNLNTQGMIFQKWQVFSISNFICLSQRCFVSDPISIKPNKICLIITISESKQLKRTYITCSTIAISTINVLKVMTRVLVHQFFWS